MTGSAPDVVGAGPDALLLPALSSVSTREEMRPLAERLAAHRRCLMPDWPGFGDRPRGRVETTPATLRAFAQQASATVAPGALGIAAGHAASYLVEAARRDPGRFSHLVLVAPTWRGPLPTMQGRRGTKLQARVRALLTHPLVGPGLYRLNVSDPVIGRMMRAHVYADPARVTPGLVAAKARVARRPGARAATAAFVTGALDPVEGREGFLGLFGPDMPSHLPPTLLLRPRGAPRRSGAEMDALAATGRVSVAEVPGALAAHEEHPDAVAERVLAFLGGTAAP